MARERIIPNADDILEAARLNADIKRQTRKLDAFKAKFRAYADRQAEDLVLGAQDGDTLYTVNVDTRYALDEQRIRAEFSPEDYPDLYEQKINTGAVRMFMQIEGLQAEDYEKPQPNRYITIKESKQ